MTAFPEIVIAGLVLAMLGVLWNPLRELKADLECYKLGERLRQIIAQVPDNAEGMEPGRTSSKGAA